MSAEEFIRYLSSLVGVAGLAVLATALGSSFGLWAAGLTLFLAGFAIGVPLWKSALRQRGRSIGRRPRPRPSLTAS
jgi:hypothetical protein